MNTYVLDLYCPNIHFQVDESLIQQNLANAPGVGSVDVTWQNGRVVVETANQDGGTDVLERLRHAGFPAEVTSRTAQASER